MVAVQYPNTICPAGFPPDAVCGRYDLGLIEMVLTIPLAAACIWLWRRRPKRASGFYIGLTLTAYAPVRFGLDFLRVDPGQRVFHGATDPRYWGLTPAQWVCFLALGVGLYFLSKTWNAPYVRTALPEGESLPGLEEEDADADEDDADAADDEADDEPESEPRPRKRRAKRSKTAAKRKSKDKAAKATSDDGAAAKDEADDDEPAAKPRKRRKKRRAKRKPKSDTKADTSEEASS